MKTLTVITTMFMPISFVAGFFGMNFFAEEFAVHPGAHPNWVFGLVLGAMVMLPPAMFAWMRWHRWL